MMKLEDVKRLSEIIETFAYGGLAYYIHKSKLSRCVSLACRIKCWYHGCFCSPDEKSLPAQFRKALEQLGPAFIKLGQLLSVRPDFIPAEYSDALRELQDRVPAFRFARVRSIVEAQWKCPIAQACSRFSKKPIASASIAQVHEARLKNGKRVAVKVRRPDVIARFQQDLRILRYIAQFIEEHWPASRPFRPKKVMEEFSEWTNQELDFRNEATIMQEIRENFKGNRKIVIPRVYWERTGSAVLTMDFLDGCSIYDAHCLKRHRISRDALAVNGAQAMFEQTILHGVFHGDPHPGNILALPKNRIGFLDFGIVGRLPARTRKKLLLVLDHLVNKDFDRAIDHVLELAETSDTSDIKGYRNKVYEVFSSYYGSTLEQNKLTYALFKAITLGVKHGVYFPSDFVLFAKTLMTTEAVGSLLNPKFNMVVRLKPFIVKAMRAELSPLKALKRFIKNVLEYEELFEDLPAHVSRIVERIEGEEHKQQ